MQRKKILIIGEAAVGKRTLMQTFLAGHEAYYVTTERGPVVKDTRVNDHQTEVKLQVVWGENLNVQHICYQDTDVIILCFAIDNWTSFNNIPTVWMPRIGYYCPNVPLILVGTKKDLRCHQNNKDQIPEARERQMANDISAEKYMECSGHSAIQVREVVISALEARESWEAQKTLEAKGRKCSIM